jgi:ATP-dependent protease ClpP protease subunit
MIIAISGEISASHAQMVRRASEATPHEPLTVVIDSPGGPTVHALALADAIAAHPVLTAGRAVRRCDSGAIAALVACETRSARLGTRFHFHQTARLRPPDGRLTAARLRQVAGELDVVDTGFRHRISAAIGCSVDELARLEASETTLDTLAALEIGLLTEITGYAALGPAAARRRAERVEARAAAARPVRWTFRDFAMLKRAGMTEKPIGISPRLLKSMLSER